jgi:thymidylate kinase
MGAASRTPCIVAIEGASAAGKSSVVDAASAWPGWITLPEAFDRIVPRPSLEFTSPSSLIALETRLLTEEAHRYRDAGRLRRQGRFVLTDTGFWAPLVYTWGLVVAGLAPPAVLRPLVERADRWVTQARWGIPDLTIYLDTTETDRLRRARAAPVDHPAHLQRRHQQVGRIERELFQKVFSHLLPSRIRFVPGAGPVTRVVGRVRAEIGAAPVAPTRASEAKRILSFLRSGSAPPRAATVKKLAQSRRPLDFR